MCRLFCASYCRFSSWDHQRHYHGICACSDHLRYLRFAGRKQDSADRQCHRAGIQTGKQLARGQRAFTCAMIFIIASMALIAKYDKDGEGTAFLKKTNLTKYLLISNHLFLIRPIVTLDGSVLQQIKDTCQMGRLYQNGIFPFSKTSRL